MTTTINKPAASGTQKLAGKYLTFRLAEASYGIQVLQVREIIRRTEITAVPRMPAYVRGVINLRGKIIPVIDMRLRFGFAENRDTDLTCIIVVQVTSPAGKAMHTGLIVDGVEEVANLSAADIEETPDFGVNVASDYILGLAKVKGAVKTLLNIERVLTTDALNQIERVVSK